MPSLRSASVPTLVFPRMIQMKIFQLRHEIAQFRPFKISWICPKTQTKLAGLSRHFGGHNSLLDLQLWFVSEGKHKIDTFIVYLWFWEYKKNFSFVTHALETKFARRNYIFSNRIWSIINDPFSLSNDALKFHFNFLNNSDLIYNNNL